jgi:hypothetical protein
VILVLVAVLALSACGGSSEPPVKSGYVPPTRGGGFDGLRYPRPMEWVNERLDSCASRDDGTFRGPDFVWECMDDGAVDACREWVGTIDSDNAYYENCIEVLRVAAAEVLADEKGWRRVEDMRLPSGLTVGDYPEAMAWVTKRRKTCAASASVEKCISDDEWYGVIPTCGYWFGGVDPENPEYTDCVEDMRYLAKEMKR